MCVKKSTVILLFLFDRLPLCKGIWKDLSFLDNNLQQATESFEIFLLWRLGGVWHACQLHLPGRGRHLDLLRDRQDRRRIKHRLLKP